MKARGGILGGTLGLALALGTTVALAASLSVTSQKLSVFKPSTLPPAGIVPDTRSGAPSAGKVNSHSWSHTVGAGSNRILVVGVSLRKNDMSVSSITYGGVGGFVSAGSVIGGGADHRVEIWYKVAPAVGTAPIAITLSGGADVEVVGGAVSYTGVNQADPVRTYTGTFGTSTTPSITVASAIGEVIVGVLSINGDTGTITLGGGQTELWRGSTGTGDGNVFGTGNSEPGAASVTMSWVFGNSNKWALLAIALKPA